MTHKRARVIVFACLIAIVVILVFGKCMPDASAEPIGPPTIETHLTNINDNIVMFKWMFGIISALLVYIYKSGNMAIMREIKHADGKAQVAIAKADKAITKADTIEKEFLSINSFKLWLTGKGNI